MSISDYYSETLILLDADSSTDGYWSTSTGPAYSTDVSLPAAVNLLSGDEVNDYGVLGIDARYKAYCAVSTEIVSGRRCRWSGDTFEIVVEPKNTLQKNHHYRILLKDVSNA